MEEPLSGTISSAFLTVLPPASEPVIAPVSSLLKIIPHFDFKKLSAEDADFMSATILSITSLILEKFGEAFATASSSAAEPFSVVLSRDAINFFMISTG